MAVNAALKILSAPVAPPDLNRLDLYSAALEINAQGGSCIPLRGDTDPQAPKAPSISWEQFQERRATEDEIASWDGGGKLGALGRVQGAISCEITVDIDDPAALEKLRAYPHLLDTLTTRSGWRRLPQLHYKIGHELADLPTRHGLRGDLLANGAYVVSAPTVIDGGRWEIVQAQPRYQLTKHDLPILFDALGIADAPSHAALQASESPLTADELQRLYRRIDSPRNEALFKVACHARDSGVSKSAVIEALAEVHAVEPPRRYTLKLTYESPEARRREALRTIDSVYSRAPRAASEATQAGGLPNTVREKLLEIGLDCTARVLDGLILAGWVAEYPLTERAAVETCGVYRISRPTVRKALASTVRRVDATTGELSEARIFVIICTPDYAVVGDAVGVDGVTNGDKKSKRGRPSSSAKAYTMPEIAYLCHILGVEAGGFADAISPDDLHSAKAYRKALHDALIRRKPGMYAMPLLTRRVGVSRRTIRRYNRELGIHAEPQYKRTPIHRGNVMSELPEHADELPSGVWLEDEQNTRYTPERWRAWELLNAGHTVTRVQQIANHYTHK